MTLSNKLTLAFFIILGMIFVIDPQLDIIITNLFWNKSDGFIYENLWFVKAVFNFLPTILYIIGTLLASYLLLSCFNWKNFPYQYRRHALFLLIALLLGPCLITNGLFKEHWGRARPFKVQEFGGIKHFTSALAVSNECSTNCSFIAGHPAGAFYFFAFAMLIEDIKKRRNFEFLAIGFGFFVGLTRLMSGKHFPSDTIFSGLINISIVIAVYYLIFERKNYTQALANSTIYPIPTV